MQPAEIQADRPASYSADCDASGLQRAVEALQGLTFWARSGEGITGDPVEGWRDRSGRENHLIGDVGSQPPVTQDAQGRDQPNFDNATTQDVLYTADDSLLDIVGTDAFIHFFRLDLAGTPSARQWFGLKWDGSAGWFIANRSGSGFAKLRVLIKDGTDAFYWDSSSGILSGTPALWVVAHDGAGTYTVRKDGVAQSGATTGTHANVGDCSNSDPLEIGGNPSEANSKDQEISEWGFIKNPSDFTAAIALIEAYMMSRHP